MDRCRTCTQSSLKARCPAGAAQCCGAPGLLALLMSCLLADMGLCSAEPIWLGKSHTTGRILWSLHSQECHASIDSARSASLLVPKPRPKGAQKYRALPEVDQRVFLAEPAGGSSHFLAKGALPTASGYIDDGQEVHRPHSAAPRSLVLSRRRRRAPKLRPQRPQTHQRFRLLCRFQCRLRSRSRQPRSRFRRLRSQPPSQARALLALPSRRPALATAGFRGPRLRLRALTALVARQETGAEASTQLRLP